MSVMIRTRETKTERFVKAAVGPAIGLVITLAGVGIFDSGSSNRAERAAIYQRVIRQQTSCLNDRFPGLEANIGFVEHLNKAPLTANSTLLIAAQNCLRDAKTQVLK